MNQLKISVVVTTYNWPEALHLVLNALNQQTYPSFEVIVADDGSISSTKELVHKFQKLFNHPLHHVWQPDNGFRVAAIRNKAIIKSTGDYIIFLDGDCIPRPDFLCRHSVLATAGSFVTGNRVLLSNLATQDILVTPTYINNYTLIKWLWLRITRKINRLSPLLKLPDSQLRYINKTKWHGAITCNLAVWKMDLATVNGFDQKYQGWGLEDSDLVIRLLNSGLLRKEGRYATGVIHLWHHANDRAHKESNLLLLQGVIKLKKIKAQSGMTNSKEHTNDDD